MALLWIDGFDELPDNNQDAYLGSAGYLFASSASYDIGRSSSGRCIKLVGSTAKLHKYIGTLFEVYTGFGFKYRNGLVVDTIANFVRDTGGSLFTQFKLRRNLSNGLQLEDGAGTILGQTSGAVIQMDVWAYIETRLLLGASTGRWVCRVNNQIVADVTFPWNNTPVDRLTFDKEAAGDHLIDDLYVLDTTGTANIGFLGDVFVDNVSLSGNATPIQWSPVGSAVNYTNINEIGPADENKYNLSATVGARDMFHIADADIMIGQIFGVMIGLRHKKIGSGPVTARMVLNDGTNDTLGTAFSPDADFKTDFELFSTTPSGTAWTLADFNALTVGYEIAS